ncbi:MAG: SMP-30/gluconolactonase/LRE family protein [Candidatus Dormibacteraeota bacterium]|nr:SMP-30/gluconolactonase/LRE family protein [Candidatus Dormibacteraeota bacterium]
MRYLLISITALAALLAPTTVVAGHQDTGEVTNFGPNLAAVCHMPEGIAIDPQGNLYASSFAMKPVANICVENRKGQLVDVIPVPAGPGGQASLLGELYDPGRGLYVLDFANGSPGNGRLLRVNVRTHAVTVVATGFQAPNALAQDRHRNLYISDSFQGAIYKVAPDGSRNQVWIQDVRLQPHGQPPFGANGVAFDRNQRFLYVATTSDDKIYRIPVLKDGSAGPMQLFASGDPATQALRGADGIAFDVKGNLYVCANSAQHPTPGTPTGEIQVLNPKGQLIARYDGIGANDLDFVASLVFKGRNLYLSNLSLDTGGANSKLSVLGVPYPGLPLRP